MDPSRAPTTEITFANFGSLPNAQEAKTKKFWYAEQTFPKECYSNFIRDLANNRGHTECHTLSKGHHEYMEHLGHRVLSDNKGSTIFFGMGNTSDDTKL